MMHLLLGDEYSFRRVFLGAMSLFVAVLVMLFGGIALVFAIADPQICAANGSAMAISTRWGFWTGCMVDLNGQLLPWDKVVATERDGKIVFVPKPMLYLKVDGNK